MKPELRKSKVDNAGVGDGGGVGPQFGVTKENYVDRAMSVVRTRGAGFVIAKPNNARHMPVTEPQWVAWMAYLDERGLSHVALDVHKVGTVPCEWPWDFDGEYPIGSQYGRFPAEPIIPNSRERVMKLFRTRLGYAPSVEKACP
jgi:hypothetical protein